MLEARGLAGALAEVGRHALTPPAHFAMAGSITGAPLAVEGELLRIGQEAIANAARHADATCVYVDLQQDARAVRIRVTDDGHGFDVDQVLAADSGHYGLTGMQERAARLGGRVVVTSSAGGTVVEASVPCARHAL
jgi:two-component system NarL family sensor kinase